MEGIQYFPNLVTLDCSKNQLTSLNLSSNSKLGYLDCGKNQLTQLTLPCHDITLSVSEPYNAAAKQGQELRSEQTVTPLHEQHHLYLFLRLNNSETFVENTF